MDISFTEIRVDQLDEITLCIFVIEVFLLGCGNFFFFAPGTWCSVPVLYPGDDIYLQVISPTVDLFLSDEISQRLSPRIAVWVLFATGWV